MRKFALMNIAFAVKNMSKVHVKVCAVRKDVTRSDK